MIDKIYVGRRKDAVARVYLRSGCGKVTINDRAFENYFPMKEQRDNVLMPFVVTEAVGKYDVFANAARGGINGQSDSIRLGIARALEGINADFRPQLKSAGLLNTAPKMVERKKFGQKKARKRFQFSKR